MQYLVGDAEVETAAAAFVWGSAAEWVTAGVAALALIVSAIAYSKSQETSRRLSLVSFEEQLGSEAAAQGRREVYGINSVRDAERLHRRHPERWDRMNHAINLWSKLAQYAELGFIDPKHANRMWGDTVVEAWPHLEHVIRYRRGPRRPDKWSTLVRFANSSGAPVPANLLPPITT